MPQNRCDGSDDDGQVSLAGVENFESKKFSCRGAQAGLSPGTDREVRTILEIMARWTILVVITIITIIISIVTIILYRHCGHPSKNINVRFRDLPPDPTECGCLKTLVKNIQADFLKRSNYIKKTNLKVLFKPETSGLREVRAVELLQVSVLTSYR